MHIIFEYNMIDPPFKRLLATTQKIYNIVAKNDEYTLTWKLQNNIDKPWTYKKNFL